MSRSLDKLLKILLHLLQLDRPVEQKLMGQFLERLGSVFNIPLSQIGGTVITLEAVVQILLAFLVALAGALLLKRFLGQHLLARLGLKPGTREAIATISSYGLGTLLCITLLQAIGINLASLAVVAGSLGIGIGFGLQDVTRNFISGIILLVEQKLKVGDFIEIGGLSGYVTEISLRAAVVRTITRKHIIVPNSYLVGHQVINWTYLDTKGWVAIPIKVAHESDPVLVIEILMDSAYLEETVSTEFPPEVYFVEIDENSFTFNLWVYVTQIDVKYKTESSLRFIIEQNLRQHGVKFASPRLDLWQRNPAVLIQSSPQEYADHAVLHQPPHLNTESFSKPVPVRTLLRQIPYFATCTDLELRKLVEVGHRRHLKASEVLYREGDPGDAFYIILSGSVGYTIDGLDQSPTIIKAGDFIGEFSLMLGLPRTVTVTALEDTTVFVISPQGFKRLLQDQPLLYNRIVQEMGRHQEELSQQQRRLRELGLINNEYDKNPVAWVQKQLERLFNKMV